MAVSNPEVTAKVTSRHLLNHTNGIEETTAIPAKTPMYTSAWSITSPSTTIDSGSSLN
jgi:hypothetical protein